MLIVASPGGATREALAIVKVRLNATGPTPVDVTLTASLATPSWQNEDTVAHAIAFDNSRCTFIVASGQRRGCDDPFWRYVGSYSYSVDGTAEMRGSVIVQPAPRTVTLTSSARLIVRGARLTLKGTLTYKTYLDLMRPQPVVLLWRPRGAKHFSHLSVVPTRPASASDRLEWRKVIHPRVTASYKVAAVAQPGPDRKIWKDAQTKPVTVKVH